MLVSKKLLLQNPDVIPRFWGLSYWRYELRAGVFYPIPINYIVRLWRHIHWQSLDAFWWVGLIDMPSDTVELWSWSNFWRIKTH